MHYTLYTLCIYCISSLELQSAQSPGLPPTTHHTYLFAPSISFADSSSSLRPQFLILFSTSLHSQSASCPSYAEDSQSSVSSPGGSQRARLFHPPAYWHLHLNADLTSQTCPQLNLSTKTYPRRLHHPHLSAWQLHLPGTQAKRLGSAFTLLFLLHPHPTHKQIC